MHKPIGVWLVGEQMTKALENVPHEESLDTVPFNPGSNLSW